MKLSAMTKAQLIGHIREQNKQIQNLTGAKTLIESAADAMPTTYETFEYLSKTSAIGLIITALDGTIISFNKTIQDMLGVDIEKFRHANVTELYADPKDREELLRCLSESKSVHNFEVQVKHQNGTLRTVLANIDHVELNDKNVLLTSLYDITQYKQSYELLNEEDKNYRKLFSDAPIGITVTDLKGNLIVGNDAMKELLGYDKKEIPETSAWDFYSIPSDRQQLIELTKKLGTVRDFETVFKNRTGDTIPVLINTDIIEFSGQKNVLLTSIRDISTLKRAERALTQERDFSNALLNIAATLIIVVNNEGVITRFNRTCEELTGYTFYETDGKYLWDAPFFDPPITRELFQSSLESNSDDTREGALISKNNEKHIISWTFASMHDQNEKIQYVIATGIDITKRKQAEDELQKANRELASRVREMQNRAQEMDQLNEMGEQLQSCRTVAEACAISAKYIKQICAASHGALYLMDESTDSAEAMEMWGDPAFTKEVFPPLDCWAIRRGRPHLVDSTHPGLICDHILGPETGQYLCVPLLVNGEAIGILHLNHIDQSTEYQQQKMLFSYNENKIQIVTTIAEHIALALSNLKLKETLRQQSIKDALTGLFNRRYMQEALEKKLLSAEHQNTPISVIMIDIDHFKTFNDLYGHDAGDELLHTLGGFFMDSTRKEDIVCRYGGEEFLLVLPDTDIETARLRAEELRQGVKQLSIQHLGKPLKQCTISLGVASYPDNGTTQETLLKASDNALYRAKDEGRDRVVLA